MQTIVDIWDKIDSIVSRTGFDKSRDFFSQELETILAKNEDKPNFSLYDLSVEHLSYRGYSDRGMPEHDAAHVILGLIFNEGLKAGVFKPEDSIDFQGTRSIEVFAFDFEVKLSPCGLINQYHEDNPDTIRLSPFHPEIQKITNSVESEENYIKSLLWVIGGQTGERIANMRYAFGEAEPTLIPKLEKIVGDMGWKTSCSHYGSIEKFSIETAEWFMEGPEGQRFFITKDNKGKLPEGSNGTEEFKAFEFPNQKTTRDIYKMAYKVLDGLRDGSQPPKDIMTKEDLSKIRPSDIVVTIASAADDINIGKVDQSSPRPGIHQVRSGLHHN